MLMHSEIFSELLVAINFIKLLYDTNFTSLGIVNRTEFSLLMFTKLNSYLQIFQDDKNLILDYIQRYLIFFIVFLFTT